MLIPFPQSPLYCLMPSKVWGRSAYGGIDANWAFKNIGIHSFIKTDMPTVRAKYSVFQQQRYSPQEPARPLVTDYTGSFLIQEGQRLGFTEMVIDSGCQ